MAADVHNNKCKGQLSMVLDKTVWWVYTLIEDHHYLTITNMRRDMAAQFSHEASGATTVCASQLEMWKVCTH